MDLLKSFNIEELPEHQTRTLHLVAQQPDFDRKLGFDACCTCAKPLGRDSVSCRNCLRVHYCSDACRQQDANVSLPAEENAEEEEVDTALGHSAVVCALLRICQDDEAVESNDVSNLEPFRVQASQDRIQSEKESYPATLANVISQGSCYTEKLKDCSIVGRIVVHVIGASVEGELWDATTQEDTSFVKAYAEALADLSESNNLEKFDLVFLGPECPEQNLEFQTPMQSLQKDRSCGNLLVRTIKGYYTRELLREHGALKPDIVVLFNPGFTVPEYSWNETLASIEKGIPFLLATNTELEGIADCQYLLDQDMIQSIPPGLAQMFDLYSAGDDDDETTSEVSFFSDNPFCGSRVRQNGTMANDLFVKNHWILGGILDSYDPSKAKKEVASKRLKQTGTNTKAGNPALV